MLNDSFAPHWQALIARDIFLRDSSPFPALDLKTSDQFIAERALFQHQGFNSSSHRTFSPPQRNCQLNIASSAETRLIRSVTLISSVFIAGLLIIIVEINPGTMPPPGHEFRYNIKRLVKHWLPKGVNFRKDIFLPILYVQGVFRKLFSKLAFWDLLIFDT
jgi:hypothetical protein